MKAFPTALRDKLFDTGESDEGMDLRDWFAGQFISSIRPDQVQIVVGLSKKEGVEPTEYMALSAYEMADAMIKAREVKG